jgi:hypothetical protein
MEVSKERAKGRQGVQLSSFHRVLCPRGRVRILSPFLCIEESFCKWIVFNFKSCDLKNKKVHFSVIAHWPGVNLAPTN